MNYYHLDLNPLVPKLVHDLPSKCVSLKKGPWAWMG